MINGKNLRSGDCVSTFQMNTLKTFCHNYPNITNLRQVASSASYRVPDPNTTCELDPFGVVNDMGSFHIWAGVMLLRELAESFKRGRHLPRSPFGP
jgi:hypothetical protein